MPAVSTNTIGPSSVSTSVSIASRVVPGRSCTTERSSPTSRLNSVHLPTLGRPTIATAAVAVSGHGLGHRVVGALGSSSGRSPSAERGRRRRRAGRRRAAVQGARPGTARRGRARGTPSARPRGGRCRPCWRRRSPSSGRGAASRRSPRRRRSCRRWRRRRTARRRPAARPPRPGG